MNRFTLLLVLVLSIGVAVASQVSIHTKAQDINAQNPGAKVYIPTSSLNYAIKQLLPLIQEQLQHISIPDQNGRVDTPIGHISYSLSQINLHNIAFQTPSIQLTGSDQLTITITGASAAVHLNWHYREDSWPHVSDSGSADASVSLNLVLTAGLNIDFGQKSGLKFSVRGFQLDITGFHLQVHGGTAWLYNILIQIFEGQIKGAIRDALRSQVPGAISDAIQDQLNTIDLQVPIANPEYQIYISFVPKRIFFNTTAQYMSLGTAGEFIKKGIAPFVGEPAFMPDKSSTRDSMIQVFLSDFAVNTAGYVFDLAGVLEYTLTHSDIPPSFPFQLNTKSFEFIVPNLYKTYPDKEMNIKISPNVPPKAACYPTGCEVYADALATFQVVVDDKAIDAFVLDLALNMNLVAKVQDLTVSGTITYKNSTLSVKSSSIGEIDPTLLGKTIELTMVYGVLPIVNAVTQKGFPIPALEGLKLINPQLDYQAGYIGVYSDFEYTPSVNAADASFATKTRRIQMN